MESEQRPVVAVLGTGIMGAPIVKNLAKRGFAVRAWNRTRSKTDELAAEGISIADTPAEAVSGAGVVLTVLKDGPAVLETMEAAAPGLANDAVWVQVSTVGEDIGRLAGFASDHGLVFLDAPVLGTRQPAENAQLIVIASGPHDARALAQPVFDAMGKRTLWVGEDGASGAASRLKLVVNTWIIALTHGIGEAFALAKGLDVEPQQFIDLVTGGPTDSPYFHSKAAAIISADFTPSFSVDNAEKDARLVLTAAEQVGIQLDLTRAGQERFARISARGRGEEDMIASYFASFPE